MNISDSWEKALKNTAVVRPRAAPLETFGSTALPYILLSESAVNPGDTVTRKGEVRLDRPSIILPSHSAQFQGFDPDDAQLDWDLVTGFLLVRGISFPSLKYQNKTDSLEVFEGELSKAVQKFSEDLARREDVATSLVVGPEDTWPFSLLICVAGQAARAAQGDVRKILDRYRRKDKWF